MTVVVVGWGGGGNYYSDGLCGRPTGTHCTCIGIGDHRAQKVRIGPLPDLVELAVRPDAVLDMVPPVTVAQAVLHFRLAVVRPDLQTPSYAQKVSKVFVFSDGLRIAEIKK